MPAGTGKTVVFSSLVRFVCEQIRVASSFTTTSSSGVGGDGSSSDGDRGLTQVNGSSAIGADSPLGTARQPGSIEDDSNGDGASASHLQQQQKRKGIKGSPLPSSPQQQQQEREQQEQERQLQERLRALLRGTEAFPRVLILAHRGELLTQAQETLRLIWPQADVSLVMAEEKDMTGQVRV